jgi:2-polyprenyl-3-methyl-5-hydroxy-6-metoxy-1,4-benzoquinol methylase
MTGTLRCNACGGTQHEELFFKDGWQLVRCRTCALVFVANPPNDEQRAALYSFASGYHQELGDNAASIAFHQREARRNLAVLTRLRRPPGRLLDIGCSSGLFLAAARDAGWQVRGLEYSPDSAQMARQQHGLAVVTGELGSDTFEPSSFDVVTLWDVIEHVPDPRTVLARIGPLLAPGGLLLLKTPNIDGLYPALSFKVARRLGFWGHPEPPGHLYQFSAATMSAMARSVGFDIGPVIQQRIPLAYSFGPLPGWFRSAKWLGYCITFSPLALVGPWLGRGDDVVVVCKS